MIVTRKVVNVLYGQTVWRIWETRNTYLFPERKSRLTRFFRGGGIRAGVGGRVIKRALQLSQPFACRVHVFRRGFQVARRFLLCGVGNEKFRFARREFSLKGSQLPERAVARLKRQIKRRALRRGD